MKITILRYSSLKRIALGLLLLLLTAKGASEMAMSQTFTVVIRLPSWLTAVKGMVDGLAAAALALFAALSMRSGKRIVLTPELAGYALVLAYFFFRSAWLDSNVAENLIAISIVGLFVLGLALDNGAASNARDTRPTWLSAVEFLSIGYVVASVFLLVAGYGYAQVGSRYYGFTYHPNTEGATAALCAAYFLFRVVEPNSHGRKRLIHCSLLAAALVLVVASGSRTAALMTLFALASLLPLRIAAPVLILAGLASFAWLGSALGSGDASVSGAAQRMVYAPSNNRNEVWQVLISNFYEHPLLGSGDTGGVSGSGVLTAFGGAGLMGGLLFTWVFLLGSSRSLSTIHKFRKVGEWKPGLVAAVLLLQIMVGSLFEGALFDKFSPIPLLTMIALMELGRGHRTSRSQQVART